MLLRVWRICGYLLPIHWHGTLIRSAVPPKPGSIHSFRTGQNPSADNQCHRLYTGRTPGARAGARSALISIDFWSNYAQDSGSCCKISAIFSARIWEETMDVHEQVKSSAISGLYHNKMVNVEVWREVSDAEFDNAVKVWRNWS